MPTRPGTIAVIVPPLAVTALPLLLLVGLTILQLFINVPDARVARANILTSFNIIRLTHDIEAAVQDAERGQRGFLLTGREEYLDPYEAAKQRLPELMVALQRATVASPDQPPRLLHLQSNITSKMNELETTLHVMRSDGLPAALAMVNTDAGKSSMDAIEVTLTAIKDAANARLAARLARSEVVEDRLTLTFLLGSVVSAIALIGGAITIGLAYRQRARSEQMLQATLDSVREGVAAIDRDARLVAWNDPLVSVLGLREQELRVGSALAELKPRSPALQTFLDHVNRLDTVARRTGRPAMQANVDVGDSTVEIYHRRTSDDRHVTTILDVTERRQAEEVLRQAQKLEAVGRMTGGVAHDFNNLLTVIVGGMGLLRPDVGPSRRAQERIDMIMVAAERGTRLTRQLLAFARRQPLQPETVNVGQLMAEMLALVQRAIGESIVVECVTAGSLWNTSIDGAQFQSAVLNLAINARDAMPQGGKLTIEVANASLDEAYAARHAEVAAGQYVMFAVTDTGTGMDAATAGKALEPFFSTKPPGEGTGLGLSQVYGFVKQSGGHIKLYSEIGEGTTVKLYLPRSTANVLERARTPVAVAVQGTETILLVDDDDVVRTTVAAMLEQLGYSVVGADSGAGALEVLSTGRTIDLLFTDVVMPGGMSGRILAERAREILPHLKVLFTSGYTENAIVHNGQLDRGVELLSKPFDSDTLATKIRRMLDGSGRLASSRQL